MGQIRNAIKNAWRTFSDSFGTRSSVYVTSSGFSPGSYTKTPSSSAADLVSAINTKIANDVAALTFKHILVDANGQFKENLDSPLNNCLTRKANIDECGRLFIQDIVLSMLDNGHIALIPIEYEEQEPDANGERYIDVYSVRTASILQWYPEAVQVQCYNEKTGMAETMTVPKNKAVIIENPLYFLMNAANSTVKRLEYKTKLLDKTDSSNYSGKMNLIIQVPYSTKTSIGHDHAATRMDEIEKQLDHSKYGIAYTDGTEKIVQLNRSIENNLLEQVTMLQQQYLNQIGIAKSVFEGTASEEEQQGYYNHLIEPIASAIVGPINMTWITQQRFTEGERVTFFNDPFRMITASKLPEVWDKGGRNEIISPNECRAMVGFLPSADPEANKLRNRNLNIDQTSAGADVSSDEKEQKDNET